MTDACTVSGVLYDAGGELLTSTQLVFTRLSKLAALEAETVVAPVFATGLRKTVTTNATTAAFSLDLMPGSWSVTYQGVTAQQSITFNVPVAASADFAVIIDQTNAEGSAIVESYAAHMASTSNPHSVTKAQVGLGNVEDVPPGELRDRSTHTGTQPISSVTGLQAALDGKATAAQGAKADSSVQTSGDQTITGVKTFSSGPIVPTASPGTDNQQAASTAFVAAALAALIGGATPETLDTLQELADALGDDPNFAATMTALIATKADKTRTVSGAGLATGSETLDNNPVITVTAATDGDVSLGQSSATVVTPLRLAERIAAFLGQDVIGDGVAFSFGGLAYFDQRGGFRGQIAEPVGAYGLSDTYESAETDGTGRVIRARTWGGLDYAPGDPAQGYGLSAEYQHVEMAPDGSLLRGQRWDGSKRDEGNGPFILDNLWAEQTETGALLRRMRMDKTFAIGPTHRIEWTAYVDGDVYLVAEGRAPFRVTLDAGTTYTYLSAKMEGLRLEIVRKAVSGGAVDMVTYALPGAVTAPDDIDLVDHILGTGQSLSVGASTNGVVTPTNPDAKLLMFNGGVKTLGGFHQISQRDHALFPDRLTDLVPAYEVAVGGQGETPMTRMGAAYRATLAADRAVLVSAHGVGSVPHSDLERGGQIYANSLAAVFWARLVAGVAGLDYRCKYVSDIQGEGNIGNTAAQRVADLIQLQEQYTEDINALTGQVGEVVLAQCQTSNATVYGYTKLPGMPEGQLQVAIDNPTKHICPGPKYWCEYTDGTHLTAEYSAKLGEVHAYHIARFEAGEDALPLFVQSAVRSGTEVTVTFRVPDDTTWEVNTSLVTDPGDWGVTFHDDGDGNSVTVSSVVEASPGVLTVTLSAVPTGSNPKIGIAVTGTAAAHAGPTTGMRSNFCAITASSHYDATPIRLWAAHQYIPVTV